MRLRPNILRPQRGLFIGGQSIPLPDLFDYSSRSGLNLVDALGGSNATILGGKVANFTGTGGIEGVNVNIPASEFFIEWNVKYGNRTGTPCLFGIGQNYTTFEILTYRTDTVIYFTVYISAVSILQFSTPLPANHKTSFNTYKIYLNGGNNRVEINGVPKIATFAAGSVTTIFPAQTGKKIWIGRRPSEQFETSQLAFFNFNNNAKYYSNNQYESITGAAGTIGSGVTFPLITTSTPASTTDALTEGYFQLSGGEQVPDPAFALPVGAVSHAGGQVHNLISSFIDFPAGDTIMDRANSDIFNATCRASIYYDSSNPRRWHVSELNYDTMQTYLEAAYTNTRFASIKTNYLNQLYIDRFFAFAAPISGKTLTYYLTLIGK